MQNRSIKRRWIIVALALFASVAAVVSSLGMQAARADNSAGVDHDHSVMFTKWITTWPNMVGIITGGDVGPGTFTGVVLQVTKGNLPQVWQAEVLYQIHGTDGRSFDANIDVTENDVINEATLHGKITNGWLQGAQVQGGYNIVPASSCPYPQYGLCYQVTLHIHPGS
jgi:hypothetical protein